MKAENSNQYKHSWDKEYSKLSEAGQNFVAVARRDASCYAHSSLSYPQLPDVVDFHIQVARYGCELTDPDREVLRELSRIAAEISETVDYDGVRRFDWPTYYEVLGATLKLAEPEVNLVGDLQRLEEDLAGKEWADTLALLDPADAEFAKRIVEDKKRGAAGTIS